jgi:hypothetical protein
MGWRDGPSGDEHPHLDKLPSSRRERKQHLHCDHAVCRLHRMRPARRPPWRHEDEEGGRWLDDEAIY